MIMTYPEEKILSVYTSPVLLLMVVRLPGFGVFVM